MVPPSAISARGVRKNSSNTPSTSAMPTPPTSITSRSTRSYSANAGDQIARISGRHARREPQLGERRRDDGLHAGQRLAPEAQSPLATAALLATTCAQPVGVFAR